MGIGFSERSALDDDMYKKASSELVVARRRRGADNGRQHVRVAAADRVQGPLGEDQARARLRGVAGGVHLILTNTKYLLLGGGGSGADQIVRRSGSDCGCI